MTNEGAPDLFVFEEARRNAVKQLVQEFEKMEGEIMAKKNKSLLQRQQTSGFIEKTPKGKF
jgi:hypothetical protein